jgi:hypothetical protein
MQKELPFGHLVSLTGAACRSIHDSGPGRPMSVW